MQHLIDIEVGLLKREFQSMGAMTLDLVRAATDAISTGWDDGLAARIRQDKDIDGRENTIDRHCIKICVTQAPVAQDMRLVFCIIRSATELERLADHAKEILRSLERAGTGVALDLTPSIRAGAEGVCQQLERALRAEHDEDSALVREVLDTAKAGKVSFNDLHADLAASFAEDTHSHEVLLEAAAVGHHLKRIYGYVGNLCKNAVYLLDGDIVRHKGAEFPLEDETPA